MLKVEDLSFQYKRNALVLKDISFSIRPGECLAIIGNNGAGKSTILKCLNRILKPDKGMVYLDSTAISDLSYKATAQQISYVDQHASRSHLTVYDMILLGRRPHIDLLATKEDHSIVQAVIHQLQLEPLTLKYVDELSGGEQKKVMIARALAQQPKVLLMDEPTSNLDLKNKHEVLATVTQVCQQKNILCVIVLHDVNLALRYCDQFILLKDHTLYAGGDASVITAETISTVYDIPVSIHHIDQHKIVVPDDCSPKANIRS